jgi:oligosaccharide repeat unit polymerase
MVLLPLVPAAGIFFLASMVAFLTGYLMFVFATGEFVMAPKANIGNYRQWIMAEYTNKPLSFLATVLFLGLLTEIIYFKNLPLLSLLGFGPPISYTEFGFPGIHGLLNAIFLVICTVLFVRQLLAPNKANMFLLTMALSWPVLLVSRQLFVSLIIQFAFLFILIKGVSPRYFLRLVILLLLLVVIFGYMGDLRSGRESFMAIAQPSFTYPEHIPSGFLWVYIYMVSPLNNVINNIDITPSYLPTGIVTNLLPSFARDYMLQVMDVPRPSWDLVDETLNVSSMHQKYIMDFGVFFTCILYLVMSFGFSFISRLSSGDPRYGFCLVVILHGILFSFFVDFILHLVFIAQFMIYIYMFSKCERYA